MRAWLMDGTGGVERLRLEDVPEPAPGPGEVLLELAFAALNPADRYLSEGQYPARPPLPHVLGRDGVGHVAAVGAGVQGLHVDQPLALLRGEVGVSRWGTFAERVVVPVESLIEIPQGWSPEQAAAAPLVYLTAYQALTQWGLVPPGVLLVTGASGGVGVASIQLGKAMGHAVVALSRGTDKVSRLRELGADHVLDPRSPDWTHTLRQAITPRRVDLAIDNIGGTLLAQVIDALGHSGKVSLVGRLAGPVPEFNTASLFFRRIRMGGVAVGTYAAPESRAAWQDILALLNRTGAKPLIDSIHPFDQLPGAFARLAEGPMGKVLLDVGGSR
jgi:NADPH2:quinone reductase